MAEVERSGDGYQVTLTAEEAAEVIRVWNPDLNWSNPCDRLLKSIAEGLRACQPPPPPEPGDRVQWRVIGHNDWTPGGVDRRVYVFEGVLHAHSTSFAVVRPAHESVGSAMSLLAFELRRDVRVGGDQ